MEEKKTLRKYMKKLRYNSIFTVNLLSMGALCIMCTLILSVFFTQKIVNDFRENLYQSSQTHLDSVVYNTDNLVQDTLHQSVVQLSYSHSILSLAMSENFSNQDANRAAADIAYAKKYNTLVSEVILYYPSKNAIFLSDYSRYTLEEYPKKQMLEMYINGELSAVEVKNNSKITNFFKYEDQYVMALDFPLYGERRLATLYYILDQAELYRRVQDTMNDGARILVYDHENCPVFSEEMEYPEEVTGTWLDALATGENVRLDDDTAAFLTISEIQGWKYLYLMNEDAVTFGIREVLAVALPVFVLVLLIAVIGSYAVARLMYRPFKRLVKQMESSEHARNLLETSKNEVDYLNLAFSSMDERNQRLTGMMSQVAEDVTTRLFLELFAGNQRTSAQIKEILQGINSGFSINAPYVACVVSSAVNLAKNSQKRQKLEEELREILAEYGKKNRMAFHIVYAGGRTFGIVLSFDEEASVLLIKRAVLELRERILKRLHQLDESVLFGVGDVYHSIADVSFSYSEAYKAMIADKKNASSDIPDTKEAVVQRKEVPEAAPEEDFVRRIQHVLMMMQSDNRQGAEELLERVIHRELERCGDQAQCLEFCSRFVTALSDGLVQMKEVNMAVFPVEILTLDQEKLGGMSLAELEAALKSIGTEVMQALSRIFKKNQNHFFIATKEYVQANCSDCDLSLNSVAEAVGANPSYISRLFKEILGISFTKYLTDCRMERSRELLKDKSIAIKDVAVQSGFNTIQNYMRVFKRYYGKTPGQYREELTE